ncbi:MAG: glycoside hydrolase family 3 N-terminal domain-containing protein [Balneolaceae bacterium]
MMNRRVGLYISVCVMLFILMGVLTACHTTILTQEDRVETVGDAEVPDKPIPTDPEWTDQMIETAVDSLLTSMTLDEKIGQLFVVPAYGEFRNDRDPQVMRLKRLITDYHVGGIIFSRGNVYDQVMLNNELQNISKFPLWVTQDMEFGAAMRVNGTTRFTPAMGVAATGDSENAFLAGMITAREARALGVHQIFAPVLDVNNNPNNPVINVRSYSADPEIVSEYATRFMQGVESEGVMATGKHFPGHGDTDIDSHLALPTIVHDYSRLDTLELVPFRNTIESGIRSIMSAHISFPNISRNIGLPTTLDDSILHDILIDSLGFDGLIITDGLEMRGISENYSPGEAVIMSLLAGVDLMLISPDEMTAINELKQAVLSDRISEERIDFSVKKLLTLKKSYGLFENRFNDVEKLSTEINPPIYQAIADRIGRESVTILKNDLNILPIREINRPNILLVSVSDGNSHPSASILAREVRRYHSNVRFHTIDARTTAEEFEALKRDAIHSDLILVGSFIMVRSHHPIQMPEDQLRILKEITGFGVPSVLMAFGNPYIVRDLPETDVHLLAWSASSDQVRQTIPSLFGASEISGTFPGTIPGMYEIGDGLEISQSVVRYDIPESVGMITDSLLNIDMVMQRAIDDSVFPGGVVGVMRNGALIWEQSYGYQDYHKTKAVNGRNIYDLASITKIMATTTSIMKLVDDGMLSLDDPVANYIKEFNTVDKKEITIRHFLLHTSGLPAYRIYVDLLKTRSEILDAIRNEPLINKPGEKYVYSDLGFILLAEIVDIVSGKRVDQFVRDEIFHPMGMHSTWFTPEFADRPLLHLIPPTEIDTVYHRGLVQGRVHDERSYYMDGIAGHAGLFSSIQDMAKYAYMLLNGGFYGGHQYFSPEIIEYFTGHRSTINHRGLGFDRKNDGFSTAGQYTGENTFGHLGFTGTSIWMDPDEDIAIILITNRTYPNRSYGSRVSRIRAEISDVVMQSIQR